MELPLRQRERHRLEVLRRYPRLESYSADSFGQVIELARRVLNVPTAAVHFPANDRLFFSSSTSVDEAQLAGLCQRLEFTDAAARMVLHEDLNKNPIVEQHPLVAGKPGFRFFASVPLRSPDHLDVGALCLFDTASRSLSNSELELLLSLADAASAELELRRAAGESRRLLTDHPHPIWLFDRDLVVVFANDAAAAFYGRERDQIVGRSIEQLLTPEDALAVSELVARGSSAERLANTGHVHADQSIRRVETTITATHHEGAAARLVEVHTTLQELQHDEEARQAEGFYRRVTDELPVQIAVLDPEGHILFANDTAILDPDHRTWIVGKTWSDYFQMRGLPPAIGQKRARFLEAAVRERKLVEFEEDLPDTQGRTRRFVTLLKPVMRSDGSVRYLTSCSVDVTERHRMEEEMRESEQRFRALIRNVPLGIALMDAAGRVLDHNPALLKTLGYVAEEIAEAEDLLPRLAHPEEAARVRQVYEDVVVGRTESVRIGMRVVRKDGSLIWTDLSLATVRDQNRRPGMVLIALEDVSDRRKAEQELERSEWQHRALLAQAPDAVFVARFRGPLIEVNARACELTGYTNEDLLRMRPEELIRNGNLERETNLWDTLAGGQPVELERRILRRDGRTVPVELSMKLIDDRFLLIIARDATYRTARASQLEFQANALSQISEAVVATDILGVLTYMNQSAERLLGVTAAEAIGRHTSEVVRAHLVGPQHIGEIAEILFREGSWRGEVSIDIPETPRMYSEVSVRLLRDKNNSPVGTLAVARDITDRKEYEHNLIVAKEEAEELNRLKSAFLANMSHEIRTPLTSIIGFAEVLSEEAAENEREFAGLIRNSGRRLMETLNSVLDLAQLENDALKLDPIQIDVMDPIRDTLDLFRAQAEERGLYLEAEADHPGPVLARLDRVGLSRILINLVSNAIKFTHQGGVRVYVRTEESHIHISVKDTGVGISREFLPHLFDEFKQESSGLSRTYEGSGLGLTITKRLVELMDGAIDVESEKGRGTVFVVTFPR